MSLAGRGAASRRWCTVEAGLSTVIFMNAIIAVLNFKLTIATYLLYPPAVSCMSYAAWAGVEAMNSFESKSARETSSVDCVRRADSRMLRGVDLFEYDDVIAMALFTLRVVSVFVWSHLFLVGAVLTFTNLAAIADMLPHGRRFRVVVPFTQLWVAWFAIKLFEKCTGYSVLGALRGACSSYPRLLKVVGLFVRLISVYIWFSTRFFGALFVLKVLEVMTPNNLPRHSLFRVLGFLWVAIKVLKKCGGYVMFWKLAELCRSQPRCKPVRALVIVAGMMYAALLYFFPLPLWWRWGLIVAHTVRALNVLSSLRRENEGANVREVFRVRGVAGGAYLPA